MYNIYLLAGQRVCDALFSMHADYCVFKKVAATCTADSGSDDYFFFLLYRSDAYKIFSVGCVSK